mmetsp:Transcript_1368/g.2492  ORF Transcript_1368/g.2492 Transcript_1368/m.2492 type:complete len:227 (+) Transcript_1368:1619-2299(+)
MDCIRGIIPRHNLNKVGCSNVCNHSSQIKCMRHSLPQIVVVTLLLPLQDLNRIIIELNKGTDRPQVRVGSFLLILLPLSIRLVQGKHAHYTPSISSDIRPAILVGGRLAPLHGRASRHQLGPNIGILCGNTQSRYDRRSLDLVPFRPGQITNALSNLFVFAHGSCPSTPFQSTAIGGGGKVVHYVPIRIPPRQSSSNIIERGLVDSRAPAWIFARVDRYRDPWPRM